MFKSKKEKSIEERLIELSHETDNEVYSMYRRITRNRCSKCGGMVEIDMDIEGYAVDTIGEDEDGKFVLKYETHDGHSIYAELDFNTRYKIYRALKQQL